MSEIRVGENESLESALKRFKRKCARSGVLAKARRREHYEKPSVKRKKKAEARSASANIDLKPNPAYYAGFCFLHEKAPAFFFCARGISLGEEEWV